MLNFPGKLEKNKQPGKHRVAFFRATGLLVYRGFCWWKWSATAVSQEASRNFPRRFCMVELLSKHVAFINLLRPWRLSLSRGNWHSFTLHGDDLVPEIHPCHKLSWFVRVYGLEAGKTLFKHSYIWIFLTPINMESFTPGYQSIFGQNNWGLDIFSGV